MNIAVITKPNMTEHHTRLKILEILRNIKDVSVYECVIGEAIPDNTDRVLVFGGDGTVLEAVRLTGGRNIAVLGINLGNMGFLTAYEQNVLPEEAVKSLMSGKQISRMLLSVEVDGGLSVNALNEVVIKTAGTRPITLDLTVDGKFVDSYHSDGLIVASPTGSTAYSLSAGGPVLAPDVDALLIIPICAHSLHSRPLVINASSDVVIRLNGEHGAYVSVDGGSNGVIGSNGTVRVSKSVKRVKFISADGDNFYSKLLKKMNRWGTTETLSQ